MICDDQAEQLKNLASKLSRKSVDAQKALYEEKLARYEAQVRELQKQLQQNVFAVPQQAPPAECSQCENTTSFISSSGFRKPRISFVNQSRA